MALRYSQHQLPHPSDLIDENEEHLFESPGQDLEISEEEDKDLQSVLSSAHTAIYHHHLQTNSKSSSNKKVSFNFDANVVAMNSLSPRDEIRELQSDKALFLDIFNEYFDESKEGDVDLNEFKKGLSKLDIQMSVEQMNKLFHVLLLNGDADDTETDYLQSEQFIDFLTRRFTATKTIEYQNILLNAIRSKTNERSLNFKPEQAEKWATTQVNLAELEMKEAMNEMIGTEMSKINLERVKYAHTYKLHKCTSSHCDKIFSKKEFNEELERRQCDPHFCVDENCENWSCYEVAFWVSKIIGFTHGDYVKKRFFDAQIDGNVLLHDVDANMLMNELKFPRLHVSKFLRILVQLQKKTHKNEKKTLLVEEFMVNDFDFLSESAANDLKMRQNLDKMRAKQLLIENECNVKLLKAKQENIALNANVNELKESIHSMQSVYDQKMNEAKLNQQYLENKLIDYESMKTSYDQICAQLNESKQALCSLKADFENKQKNQSLVENAADWTTKEVAIWLNQIGMNVYAQIFIHQFIDGQILLNDITQQNLISDLCVKSLHAPKIMRELNKIKTNLGGFGQNEFEICENVTNATLESKESTLLQQIDSLKNDLSEARIKLNNKRLQIEDLSRERRKLSKMKQISMTSVLSGTDQSVYSIEGGIKRSTLSPILGSTASHKQQHMDDYELPSEAISENWRKYVESLENKYSHLSSLFVRADNALKKYKVAIVPFKERISDLETQNSTRIKTIDKLKKRVERRDETIRRLKAKNITPKGTGLNQQFGMPILTSTGPIIPQNVKDSAKFLNLGYKQHQNSLMMPQPPVHAYAHSHQQGTRSRVSNHASDDDNVSVIGSLASGLYGFFTSSDTPQ